MKNCGFLAVPETAKRNNRMFWGDEILWVRRPPGKLTWLKERWGDWVDGQTTLSRKICSGKKPGIFIDFNSAISYSHCSSLSFKI